MNLEFLYEIWNALFLVVLPRPPRKGAEGRPGPAGSAGTWSRLLFSWVSQGLEVRWAVIFIIPHFVEITQRYPPFCRPRMKENRKSKDWFRISFLILVFFFTTALSQTAGFWTIFGKRHPRIPKHTQALSGEPAAPSESGKPGLDNESKSLGVYKMEWNRCHL